MGWRNVAKAAMVMLALPGLMSTVAQARILPAAEFANVLHNSNAVPYVQESMTQTEHLSFSGVNQTVTTKINVDVAKTNKSLLEKGDITLHVMGQVIHEQLYVANGTAYSNIGTGWKIVGHIAESSLLSLQQFGTKSFSHVTVKTTKQGHQYSAQVDPKSFTSLVQQALGAVVPAQSSKLLNKSSVQAMAAVFADARVNIVANSQTVLGKERVAKLDVMFDLTITGKELKQLAAALGTQLPNSGTQTVTSSVYGKGSLPSLKLSLKETAQVRYQRVPVTAPKGIPKSK